MSQYEDLRNNKDAFSWLAAPEKVQAFHKEMETDILIIGAGHAGIAAARGAIEENGNIRVLVAEQQKKENQWILGNGEIGHINSVWLASKGLPKVDVDEFVNDWQLRTNNRSNYALIRKYAENSGACFDWIIEVLDEEERESIYPMLAEPSLNMPKTLNYIRAYPGTAVMTVKVQDSMMKKNMSLAAEKGVQFLFETKAYELLTEDGRISGAVLQDKEGFIKVSIKKGVILAAGDYSRNAQMCRDLLTEAADMISQETDWIGHGWVGDGLRLGMLAGGRMEPRSHAAMGGNYSLPGFEVIGSAAVLRVNAYGKRYSNEGFGSHILAAMAGAKQPNGMLYGIFDSRIKEQLTYQTNCHAVFDYCNEERITKLDYDLERARKAGSCGAPISVIKGSEKPDMVRVLYGAETIEKLASYLYKDEENKKNFLDAVERYNKICRQRKDTDFGKDTELLHGVLQAPFYAVGQLKDSNNPIGQSYKILVTVSGLLIDENQQVLNDEYKPIPGLYATGNNSGCRFGMQYMTSIAGQSISMAQTLGREVGKYLAVK